MGVNIRDIAKMAGVSATTVSFVINKKKGVSDETRERIERLLVENGYTKRRSAAKRKTGMSVCIVKYVADSRDDKDNYEIDSYIIASMHAICSDMNIRVFMTVCHADNFQEVVRGTCKERYGGIVIIGTMLGQDQVRFLDGLEIAKPLVVVDHYMMHTNVCSVTTSDREIGHMAVKHLYDRGIRSIGHLQGAAQLSKFSERQLGYEEIMRTLDLKSDASIALRPTLGGAYEQMNAYLKRAPHLPEAFFADTGLIALGAMRALKENGVRIPEDVSIISGDDMLFGMFSAPPLTAISSPYEAICKHAIRLIVRRMKEEGSHGNAEHISVRGQLIVRGSTRA